VTDIELTGFSELEAVLNAMPDLALDAAEAAMSKALMTLHGRLPDYPPPPMNSTYRRTGTLGRQFTERVTRDEKSVTGELGTATPYAPWVVGPDHPGEDIRGKTMYQAKVHRGRWWQFEKVVASAMPEAQEAFNESFFAEFEKRVKGA